MSALEAVARNPKFPMTIYHPALPPEVVGSEDELNNMIDHGWTESYQEFTTTDLIDAKIKWHKAEIKQLESNKEILLVKAGVGKEALKEKVVDLAPPGFVCEVCGREFRRDAAMKSHMRVHKKKVKVRNVVKKDEGVEDKEE